MGSKRLMVELVEVGIHCARMALWRYEAVGKTRRIFFGFRKHIEKIEKIF